MENPASGLSDFNKLYDGLSKSELTETLAYEIEAYRSFDEMSEYEQGFLDALRWVFVLLNPDQDGPKWAQEE